MTIIPDARSRTEGRFMGYTEVKRIHFGLRWDPIEETVLGTDMDVTCVMFDEYGGYIGDVTGEEGRRTDEDGSVHHSGDEEEGMDMTDDERITLDLFHIPLAVAHLFIVVEVHGERTFETIPNPFARVAETISDRDIWHIRLGEGAGEEAKSFIFCRISRVEGGWRLFYVGQYPQGETLPDWRQELIGALPEETRRARSTANLPVVPEKGGVAPLYYTKQARHRILCGISWDQRGHKQKLSVEEKSAKRGGGEVKAYDLDLTCILFDKSGEYADYVTSAGEHNMDASGAVWHTGDDNTGEGKGDDEQVSVELLKLPPEIQTVFFIVEIKSAHTFGQVGKPMIRLADGMSNRNQLKLDLGTKDGGDKNACVFAKIFRSGDNWTLHYIGDYVDTAEVEDWVEPLERYL